MDNENDSLQTPILLLDGGLGTTLSSAPYNVTYSEQTPLWSSHLLLSAPETLLAVHKDFLTAGANIVLSATYQASYEGFARTPRLDSKASQGYGQDEAGQHMRKAVDLAAQAISISPSTESIQAVGLSLGAYGAILSPSQEFSGVYPQEVSGEQALASWHRDRIDVFRSDATTWQKVEYVAFETVRPVAEIRGIRRAACGIGKKWWISHVVPGDVKEANLSAIVTAMVESEEGLEVPWGIGANCTAVHKIGDVEREYRDTIKVSFPHLLRKLWLVFYPDGTIGEIYDTKTMTWVKTDENALSRPWIDQVMNVLTEARASNVWKGIIVGGCCKTLPEDIKELHNRIVSL